MGFFNKEDKEKGKAATKSKSFDEAQDKKKKVAKKDTKSSDDKKQAVAKTPSDKSGKVFDAIIFPWITEKTHEMASSNKYTFKVESRCNKSRIKNAVEVIYDVKVEKVNVVNVDAKKRRFGRKIGKKAGYKKAIVTVKKGDKIDFFQGV